MTTDPVPDGVAGDITKEQKNIVLLVYILQAASFVVGISALAAVIIDYIKRDELRGSWLESHINWQIKTFWYALAGGIAGAILLVIAIGALVLMAVAVWVVYRIVKGWLAFNESKELPDTFF
jgi:uncharacterized membrane protein